MNFKVLLMMACSALSLGVLADAANVLITYSSKPVDCYADGRPVADGEWYALVWTPNGEFGGIKPDCTPMVAGDEIVMKAPLAKDGHCPCTVFQIDSGDFAAKGYVSGWFAVILLDTRDEAGKPATSGKDLVVHNTAISTIETIQVTMGTTGASVSQQEVDSVGKDGWVLDMVPTPVYIGINPSFVVEGVERVGLTVSNVFERFEYKVGMGESLDKMETFDKMKFTGINADTTVTFDVEKKNSGFFSISPSSKYIEKPSATPAEEAK